MEEVYSSDVMKRFEREQERTNAPKLLEILQKLFPTWNWLMLPISPGDNTYVHFYHDNPLHGPDAEEATDILHELLSNCVLFYHIESEGEQDDLDWSEPPRLYYNMNSAERLLITHRHWLRRNAEDAEYDPVNNLVWRYFDSSLVK